MRNKKKILIIVLSALTVVSFAACSKSDDDDNKNLKTGTVDYNTVAMGLPYYGSGYTLTLPENWMQSDNSSADLMFADQNSPSSFSQTINVVIEDCTEYDSIEDAYDYYEAAAAQFEHNDSFTVTGTDSGTINGNDVVTVFLDANNGVNEYKCEQVYFVKDQIAYVLTYTGDAEGGFEETKKEAESIFNTFTFVE